MIRKLISAAATVVLVVIGQACSIPNSAEFNNSDNFIPVDSANKMLNSYINSIDSAKIGTQLYSLIMEAEDLRAYLRDTTIIGIKIMFAHTLDYINDGNQAKDAGMGPGLTVVLGGFDNNGNYVLAPDNKVPDNARLCPPMCINSGTAAQNTFE